MRIKIMIEEAKYLEKMIDEISVKESQIKMGGASEIR